MKTLKILLFGVVFSFFFVFNLSSGTQSNVSGVVLDKGGMPVPGAIVTLYEHGTSNVLGTTLTNANGNFVLSGITGIVDLILIYPEDDDDSPATIWYNSSSDQSGATPIDANSDISGLIVYAFL